MPEGGRKVKFLLNHQQSLTFDKILNKGENADTGQFMVPDYITTAKQTAVIV